MDIGRSMAAQRRLKFWTRSIGMCVTFLLRKATTNTCGCTQAWLYGQGHHLPVELEYDTSLAKEVYSLATDWDAARSTSDITQLKFKESDLKGFDSNQISQPPPRFTRLRLLS